VPESTRVEIFPELATAARLLSGKGLPEGMEFDRLVVDEAQDLTLTEFWMLLELLRACRKRTGKSPWLLIAGDAGQRVEASGFEWGRYTELLSSRWRRPATFDLQEHVRCPARIAAVVNLINDNYFCRLPRTRSAGSWTHPESCETARFPRGGRVGHGCAGSAIARETDVGEDVGGGRGGRGNERADSSTVAGRSRFESRGSLRKRVSEAVGIER